MATATATNYSEVHRGGDGGQYETDRDDMSTTLTNYTGYSTESRNSTLPRLRNAYRLKGASSFPNLLSLYEEPIREESADREKVKTLKASKRSKRKKETNKNDHDDAHEHRARNEMRQLRMDAVAREQLEKFDNYVATMREKVVKQREERKKYNEILQERLKEQEELERKKLRLHRGPKHVFVNDRSFLKSLPVSNYCKAARLADQLQRKGVLRTSADIEKYWSGYANSYRQGEDIFSDASTTSVNFPRQWMGMKKPEIKITEDEDDQETITDAASLAPKQLPPIKKRKK
ncbi:hypothetical protein ACF0H5_018158 [Mactra antiquata]